MRTNALTRRGINVASLTSVAVWCSCRLSSADLETVLNILYTCLNSIGESGDKDGAAHGEGGPHEAGARQWPEERDEEESDSQRHQEKGASEEHAKSHALEVRYT